MTEAEAKTKWCPFARVVIGSDTSELQINPHNVFVTGGESERVKCIASACMAWRWNVKPEVAAKFKEARQKHKNATNSDDEIGPQIEDGYCGLAGHN